MTSGYDKPLYILPFDHRHSFVTGVFHWQEPLAPEQVAEIVASKQVIYDGFKAAVDEGIPITVSVSSSMSSSEPPSFAMRRPAAMSRAYPPKRAVRTSSTSNTATRSRTTSRR